MSLSQQDLEVLVNDECYFVYKVLNKFSFLTRDRIELIRNFSMETGYNLTQSVHLVDAYIGRIPSNISQYIRDLAIMGTLPNRKSVSIENTFYTLLLIQWTKPIELLSCYEPY